MASITRRRLLRRLAAGMGLFLTPGGLWGRAGAAAWDDLCGMGGTGSGLTLPVAQQLDNRTYKILEIHLQGGLSTAETLWLRSASLPAWAAAPDYAIFDSSGACATASIHSLGTDSNGQTVGLAPCTYPMFGGANAFVDRLRLVSLSHIFTPHTAAVPYALAGLTLGRPALAGLGAAIEAVYGAPATPASYVLHGGRGRANSAHAATIGLHGAAAKPIVLSNGAGLLSELGSLSRDSDQDALLAYYGARYAALLEHNYIPVRSKHFEAWLASACRTVNSTGIGTQLAGLSLASGGSSYTNNPTRASLDFATDLLRTTSVRHVAVIDQGVAEDYDQHHESSADMEDAATKTAGNLWNVLDALAGLVGSADLDLDDVLVVLNTEFGRRAKNGDGSRSGTEHHPDGYCVALIGGPLSGGASVYGGFEDTTGPDTSTSGLGPPDLRGALLIAAGIDPNQPETLATADWAGGTFDDAGLRSSFFGV